MYNCIYKSLKKNIPQLANFSIETGACSTKFLEAPNIPPPTPKLT